MKNRYGKGNDTLNQIKLATLTKQSKLQHRLLPPHSNAKSRAKQQVYSANELICNNIANQSYIYVLPEHGNRLVTEYPAILHEILKRVCLICNCNIVL